MAKTSFSKTTNNGQSTLAADITTTGQSTITIQSGDTGKFPTSGNFWVRVYNNATPSSATQSEIMLVTAVASNVFTVTRNYDGAGASTFSSGHAVVAVIRKEYFEEKTTALGYLEDLAETGWYKHKNSSGNAYTYTYVSATSVYCNTDATSVYQVGSRIKFTQSSTTKYFVVTSLSYDSGTNRTTFTLFAGTDYTVANTTISNVFYSYLDRPFGFPDYFNYSCTISNSVSGTPAVGNGTLTAKAQLYGKKCCLYIFLVCGSTTTLGSTSGQIGFSTPTGLDPKNNLIYDQVYVGFGNIADSGLQLYSAEARLRGSLTTVYLSYNTSAGSPGVTPAAPFTFGTGDDIYFTLEYPTSL